MGENQTKYQGYTSILSNTPSQIIFTGTVLSRDVIQRASSGTQFESSSVEEALSSVQQNFYSSLGVQLPFLKVTWKNVK